MVRTIARSAAVLSHNRSKIAFPWLNIKPIKNISAIPIISIAGLLFAMRPLTLAICSRWGRNGNLPWILDRRKVWLTKHHRRIFSSADYGETYLFSVQGRQYFYIAASLRRLLLNWRNRRRKKSFSMIASTWYRKKADNKAAEREKESDIFGEQLTWQCPPIYRPPDCMSIVGKANRNGGSDFLKAAAP